MNRSTVALLTETWFNKGNKKTAHDLQVLNQKNGIAVLRKDRTSRGGGIAIAYDQKIASFKKIPLNTLRGSKFEIMAASGKINGIKKNHIVFVCYLPPSYTASENRLFFDVLTDAVSEAHSKFPESWVTIGGDWNNRALDPVLDLFPDLSIIPSAPTRKDATLDVVVANYKDHIIAVKVNHPLESEDGSVSDHGVLQIDSILPRPRSFTW